MDVMKKYRFEMNLVPENARRAHEAHFERAGIDWHKAVWGNYGTAGWDVDFTVFRTEDGKCEACTKSSYFLPCLEGPVNLEDYM